MAKELIDCRQSFVSMDVESAREHISYQQGLCSEIRFLDHELGVLRAQTVGAAALQAGGLASIADLLCRANELGYGYREKRLPDPLEAIEWEILREKSPKLVRLGPAHVVQELSGHAKRIQKHVKSVFQG